MSQSILDSKVAKYTILIVLFLISSTAFVLLLHLGIPYFTACNKPHDSSVGANFCTENIGIGALYMIGALVVFIGCLVPAIISLFQLLLMPMKRCTKVKPKVELNKFEVTILQ